jgi:transposase-like protein
MMPRKSQPIPPTGPVKPTTMPPKKVYSREFKLEALRLLKRSGNTKTELERALGLYQGQLHLWENAFNKVLSELTAREIRQTTKHQLEVINP